MEEVLEKKPVVKWYFSTYFLIVAFLCVGPLSLPLVLLNPRFSKRKKIVISSIFLIITCLLAILFSNALKTISKYYQLMSQ